MDELTYVSEESAAFARIMESKLLNLPEKSGVLFVSVKPVPALKGKVNSFEVTLGISRSIEESTGMALIRHAFDAEMRSGLGVSARVFRGVSRGVQEHFKGTDSAKAENSKSVGSS